jgi:hypothetical protein
LSTIIAPTRIKQFERAATRVGVAKSVTPTNFHESNVPHARASSDSFIAFRWPGPSNRRSISARRSDSFVERL